LREPRVGLNLFKNCASRSTCLLQIGNLPDAEFSCLEKKNVRDIWQSQDAGMDLRDDL
jgi:hypothetical protein